MTVPEQQQPEATALGGLDVERFFRPSGRLLEAQTALGKAIEVLAVARTPHKPTTLDLLVRLSIAPENELRGVDLCHQLLKSPGYVSRVVDEAEASGLVVRRPDPDDRRAQRISITAAGEKAIDAFVPDVVGVLRHTVYCALDDAEVEILIDLLTRLTTSAHQLLDRVEQQPG